MQIFIDRHNICGITRLLDSANNVRHIPVPLASTFTVRGRRCVGKSWKCSLIYGDRILSLAKCRRYKWRRYHILSDSLLPFVLHSYAWTIERCQFFSTDVSKEEGRSLLLLCEKKQHNYITHSLVFILLPENSK